VGLGPSSSDNPGVGGAYGIGKGAAHWCSVVVTPCGGATGSAGPGRPDSSSMVMRDSAGRDRPEGPARMTLQATLASGGPIIINTLAPGGPPSGNLVASESIQHVGPEWFKFSDSSNLRRPNSLRMAASTNLESGCMSNPGGPTAPGNMVVGAATSAKSGTPAAYIGDGLPPVPVKIGSQLDDILESVEWSEYDDVSAIPGAGARPHLDRCL